MSFRSPGRSTHLPNSHVFVSIARGGAMRTFALRVPAMWTLAALACLVLVWASSVTAYIIFHDDMLTAYLVREARLRNAYEDRIAEARGELDRVASRQLLDQNSFEGRMHELVSRQARIESHDKIIDSLSAEAFGHDPHSELRPQLPSAGKADAPAAAVKRPPAPEPKGESLSQAAPDDSNLGAAARLGQVDVSLERLERGQLFKLAGIAQTAHQAAAKLDAVVARVGLNRDQLTPQSAKGGVGGPFVALADEASAPAFDRVYARAAREVERTAMLRRLLAALPVREPLVGEASVSSGFGYRTDPFLGRPALHPGVDLVQAYGSEIKATASGRVTHAGAYGGYGEMVEIDHGNGIVTRYGHMSEVLVSEGDTVKAGDTLGRIGSTGRSTGPHLHYEVRVDGEPVDPERFRGAANGVGDLAGL